MTSRKRVPNREPKKEKEKFYEPPSSSSSSSVRKLKNRDNGSEIFTASPVTNPSNGKKPRNSITMKKDVKSISHESIVSNTEKVKDSQIPQSLTVTKLRPAKTIAEKSLIEAIKTNDMDDIEEILETGIDINIIDEENPFKPTALILGLRCKNKKILKRLIEAKVDVNTSRG